MSGNTPFYYSARSTAIGRSNETACRSNIDLLRRMLYHVISESLIGDLKLKFQIELDREEDGRWMAEIAVLPGVMAYGRPSRKR